MLAAQDSMPLRLHKVYFINAPAFINNVLNIFYPLLKPKLVDKVFHIFLKNLFIEYNLFINFIISFVCIRVEVKNCGLT